MISGRAFASWAGAILSLAGTGMAGAQQVTPVGPVIETFASYGVDEGLSSLSTTVLEIDANGSLWIGTHEGVVRFDGERFITFSARSGLPSGHVLDLAIDGAGTVWVGTLRGLARLDHDRFIEVDLPGSPAGETVAALAVDAQGRLVAGALGGLYVCASVGCSRTFTTKANERVSAIALDRLSGDLWLGGPFGLVRWRDQELERWTSADGLPTHETRALMVDRYGILWVRLIEHLVRIDTAQRTIRSERFASAVGSSQIFEDREGGIWAASDLGLLRRDSDGWTRFDSRNGLPADGVAAILEDREGALWIGTADAGLVRWLGRNRFTAWTSASGLPRGPVWSIARGSDGAIAFGTQSGVAILDPERQRFITYGSEAGLDHDFVRALAADATGGYWIGSIGGVAHLDHEGRIVDVAGRSPLPEGFSATRIARGADATIWLASNQGLWRGRGRPDEIAFERVELPGESPAETILDLLIEPSGVVWAAGRHGLARLENGAWRRLGVADGLTDEFVASLTRDGDGAIWIGYRDAHGVSELLWANGQPRLRHFGFADGLRHNQVTFVRADALGRVWVGTTRGISIRTPRSFAAFSRSDGLYSEVSSANAFLADEDGTVWIGTPRGAISARLSRDDLEPRPPLEARVLSLAFNGQRFAPASAPKVPFTARTVEIAFSARTFRAPQEVEFRYQLLGLDESPVLTSMRTLRYPALPYGKHRFVVSARLAGESWGPPADVRFEVLPPWWSTAPARILALLLAAGLGVLLDRVRTSRLRRRRRQLEEAVAERTREVANGREELERKNEELAHLSLTDPLTGLKNRRYAWEFLAEEVERVDLERASAEAGSPPAARLVFFLMDVDLFKGINDLHGHEIGDEILVEAAERVREATRISDIAVRWGGEEFLVIARDLPAAEWPEFAARLRAAIAKPPYLPSQEVGPVTCTASLGYAAYPFHDEMDLGWQQVLKLADLALYAVKQCGRDADLGIEPGPGWKGRIPQDLLAAQVGGAVHLNWGNIQRPPRG